MSRIESDFLGELEIPDEAYYGVQTMRGKHNFNITEMPMSQGTGSSPSPTAM